MPLKFYAIEHIPYVSKPVDREHQILNIYVKADNISRPDNPVLIRNFVGGYMSSLPVTPYGNDPYAGFLTEALAHDFVVVVPGTRGSRDMINGIYTGKAPASLVDLKAVIRFLRRNKEYGFFDTERIFSDGFSAGGALSALLGTTGNLPDYAPYLDELGAADERDDIFASICFCPITDLENADMAYEWNFGKITSFHARHVSVNADGQKEVSFPQVDFTEKEKELSQALSSRFAGYIHQLRLLRPESKEVLTLSDDRKSGSYFSYLCELLARSARTFLLHRNAESRSDYLRENDWLMPLVSSDSQVFTEDIFSSLIEKTSRKKTCPAFDSLDMSEKECILFGSEKDFSSHFDPLLYELLGSEEFHFSDRVGFAARLMNPMKHILEKKSDIAPHFYIRTGSMDTDTAYTTSMNLALALKTYSGCTDVDYQIAWDKPHSGDYSREELFQWMHSALKNRGEKH